MGSVRIVLVLGASLASSASFAQTGSYCEPLPQEVAGGLMDVNDPTVETTIRMVESYHFTPEVENLVRGSTGSVPADLDFVLRKIPNHYRALAAMGRWQLQNGLPRDAGRKIQSADCYYQRAISFRPNDAGVHQAYAVYLHQSRKYDDAEVQYAKAAALGAGGAEFFANRGLLMIEIGDLAKAQEYSTKAYDLGYPLPGLRNKLASAKAKAH